MKFLVNGRFLTRKFTGVEKVAINYTIRLQRQYPQKTFIIIPKKLSPSATKILKDNIQRYSLKNVYRTSSILRPQIIGGYLWEQIFLPYTILKNFSNDDILINFTNTSPVIYNNSILFIHDVAFLEHPEYFSKTFVLTYKLLIKQISKKAKLIVTVSKFTKKQIVKYLNVPEDKIKVIYLGLNPLIEPTDKYEKNFLTFIGSINPRKNITNTIKAFLQLKENDAFFHDKKLVLIGKKHPGFKSINLIKHPDIIYTGYIDKSKFEYYLQRTLIGLNLSFYEGFSLTPGEFLLSKIPVVISDIPVHREIYGNFATFADPLKPKIIAKAIASLAKDKTLIKQQIKKATSLKAFTWDKAFNKFDKILQSLQNNMI